MLAFQLVTRQPVIKFLLRRLPVDQTEVHPVMIEVATHAIFAIRIAHLNLEVIAVFRFQPSRNFFVAFQALECGRTGPKLVAARALRRTGQGLVSFRKRPRRNLRWGSGACKHQGEETSQTKACPQQHRSNAAEYTLRAELEAVQASLRRGRTMGFKAKTSSRAASK